MQVNRFNCGADDNAGMVQRQTVTPNHVNFQERFPVIVSNVDCGVIVLLLAADKPLEESGLHWILSGGRQTGSFCSTRQHRGVYLVTGVFPLCVCTNKTTQHVV